MLRSSSSAAWRLASHGLACSSSAATEASAVGGGVGGLLASSSTRIGWPLLLARTAASAASPSPPAAAAGVAPAAATATASTAVGGLRQRLAEGPAFDDFVQQRGPDYSVRAPNWKEKARKPDWLKRSVPGGEPDSGYARIKSRLRELKLATVCEEARCPNVGECWGGEKGHATATIMLMGDTCTRGCRFCAVKTSQAPPPLDPAEPARVATAVAEWGIGYVVLTSVDRDDLPDGGAAHIAQTVRELKTRTGGKLLVEALVPDFKGDLAGVQAVVASGLDVYAHNVETVPRLQASVRDRRAGWDQSIATLVAAKAAGARLTKTSLMLGCGETREEVLEALALLRAAGVDVVTFGQYMRPTKKHMPVSAYITPDAFAAFVSAAEALGFAYAAGGPMVRSSYRAGEFYLEAMLKGGVTKEGVAAA